MRYIKGTRLPLPTIVTYVNLVADALQYAHEKKLIHRDVKPENMLMGRHNDVLLSDFGIAVIAHSTFSQKMESPAGTLAYTAPEQLRGHPRPASDQYSLGVVVYEWLCGDRPFQGAWAEVAMQHAMMPPPSLRQKAMEIPAEVERVVMKALAKDPEGRFPSVRAFADALEGAILTQPHPQSNLWNYFKDRISRRTVLIGLSSLVVIGDSLTGVTVVLKPPARGTIFYTLPLDDVVYAVAWSADGTHLAAASSAQGVQVWDAAAGTYVLTNSVTASVIATAVAWSPDGRYIASGGSDATVQVWEAFTRRNIFPPIKTGHTGYNKVVNAVAWSPNGKYLASAGEEGYVKVWDAGTGYLKYTYKGHIGQYGGSPVNAVAWSPDGTRIASGSDDMTVQVWIPGSSEGETLHYSGHTDSVEAIAWSSDGQHLASGSVDKTVRVWDLSSSGNPYIFQGHKNEVYTIAWSPGGFPWPWSHEGQRLASGGKDATVRLWQAV